MISARIDSRSTTRSLRSMKRRSKRSAERCVRSSSASVEVSAYDVAARLTWTRHEHPLADLDTFNQTLAVLETRAHLELLVARGDAAAVDTADGRAYAPSVQG